MKSIWISEEAFTSLVTEANRVYPLETGGVLLGYFAENGEPVVFTNIGPGPAGVHLRTRFTPDHSWQCKQIDLAFEKSNGTLAYMGDWHTHPDTSPQMSWLDQRTLRTIARHPQARISQPLMLIGGGTPQNWTWISHQYRGERLLGLIVDCEQHELRSFRSEEAALHGWHNDSPSSSK